MRQKSFRNGSDIIYKSTLKWCVLLVPFAAPAAEIRPPSTVATPPPVPNAALQMVGSTCRSSSVSTFADMVKAAHKPTCDPGVVALCTRMQTSTHTGPVVWINSPVFSPASPLPGSKSLFSPPIHTCGHLTDNNPLVFRILLLSGTTIHWTVL
jgi:hypothetical protein